MLTYFKTRFGSDTIWEKEFERIFQNAFPGPEKYSILSKIINFSEYSYPHLKGNNNNYKKFIILSKPRGGSTYLVDLLQSHTNIACYNELFLPDKCAFFYRFFPEEDDKNVLYLRNKNPQKFMQHFIFRKYIDTISAVGFKIFYKHGSEHRFSGIWKRIRSYPDLHVIHLIRKNHLRSLISLKLAEKTNRWTEKDPSFLKKMKENGVPEQILENISDATPAASEPFRIAFNDALEYFRTSENCIQKFTSSFSGHPYTEVFYEDLVSDLCQSTKIIMNFLGVPYKELKSRYTKQNRKKMSEIIINYSELKDMFSKTKWAGFFDE